MCLPERRRALVSAPLPIRAIRNWASGSSSRADSAAIRLALLENGIERTLAIAFEVERDVHEASLLEARRKLARHRGVKRARQLFNRDLDAGQLAVRADTELPEAQLAENRFASFDLAEDFRCHSGSVRHARREAGRSRPVPCCKACLSGKVADFTLGESGAKKGCKDSVLGSGAVAGPEVVRVISIDAVCDCGESARSRKLFHPGEQLVFAVEAAIRIVRDVKRIFEFVRFDE